MSDSLEILYQDEYLVAVDKPAGHLVHPASEPQADDLVAMKILRDQIGQRVHSIHRLDRPTSGVLLFGIDKGVARSLHKALEHHLMQKTYWAVVEGVPEVASWRCEEPIQKDEGAPVRDACTDFKVIAERRVSDALCLTLLEAVPQTGRFHQIRRHLLSAGLPIVGDYRYAGIERSDELGALLGTGSRMLLQAKSLEFEHPVTGEGVKVVAPVAEEISTCFPALSEGGR